MSSALRYCRTGISSSNGVLSQSRLAGIRDCSRTSYGSGWERATSRSCCSWGSPIRRCRCRVSLDYWRKVTGRFAEELVRTPDLEVLRHKATVALTDAEAAEMLDIAPFMPGFEYLNRDAAGGSVVQAQCHLSAADQVLPRIGRRLRPYPESEGTPRGPGLLSSRREQEGRVSVRVSRHVLHRLWTKRAAASTFRSSTPWPNTAPTAESCSTCSPPSIRRRPRASFSPRSWTAARSSIRWPSRPARRTRS